MNQVNCFSENFFLLCQFLEFFQMMNILNFLLDYFNKVNSVRPVNLIYPNRIHVLKQQEIANVRILRCLSLKKHSVSDECLLKSFLNYIILGHLSKQISQISFFLNIIFYINVVVLSRELGHLNLLQDEIKLAFVGMANQFKLSIYSN